TRRARAAVSARQISGLADLSAGFVLRCHCAFEYPRRDRTVRLERRIAGLVVFAIDLELPSLAREPSQYAGLDGGEVAADQHVPGRCADDAPRDIASTCERSA